MSTDITTPFEKPTDELRQVHGTIRYTSERYIREAGPGLSAVKSTETMTVVRSVQRKWWIQDGPDHFDEAPDKTRQWEWLPTDTERGVYTDCGSGRIGRFCYLREEWRDLPVADLSTNL